MEIDEARWLTLDRAPGETLRAALERSLREAIVAGALRAGVRLPGSRVLAGALGVSRGVVSDAYGQLEAQGFLETRARAAPVVAATPSRSRRPRSTEPSPLLPRYDLTPTTPDVTLFPLNRWLASAQQAARQAGPLALDYREPRGERVLREALADPLGRTRGVIADPDQIVISGRTRERLRGPFNLAPLGTQHLRGRHAAMELFVVHD